VNVEQPFASGDSALHRLDPRVKVPAAAALSIAIAVLTDLSLAAFALAAAACLLCLARPSARRVVMRLLFANAFVAAAWLFLPWTTPGRAVGSFGPVTFTGEGVSAAALITVKCNAILMTLIALLATSSLAELARALGRLRVSPKLLMIFFFCVRYVSVIRAEYGRLSGAMKVRAFVPRAGLAAYKTYANMLGTLIVRAHDRAGRIHQAMLCRGFDGQFRTLRHLKLRAGDVAAGSAIAAFAALLLVLQWTITAQS